MTLQFTTLFVEVRCGAEGCDALFAVPEATRQRWLSTHETWYCPKGHARAFNGPSKLELAERQLVAERARLDQMQAARDALKRRLSAAKAQVTRVRNRVQNGVCPCCNRSFQNLRRHMASKHPEAAK